jgi:tripeptide aminopeptidase
MTPFNNPVLDQIISDLPDITEKLRDYREIVLANLAMLGETPAPTFKEERRIKFLLDRFTELGLSNASMDEVGNGIGVVEGSEAKRNILIVAHADTISDQKTNHNFTITPDEVIGPGVADNSLGIAVLASLPYIMHELDIKLNSNLILMGGTRSLGRGNLEGLRFFLANSKLPVHFGLCMEGVKLGRLSHSSIGMLRGDITCTIPEEYDWSRFGSSSAILTLNEVINKINDIRLPKRPKSSIVMGSINGGGTYNNIAKKARLKFEIRSESGELTREIGNRFEEIVTELSSVHGDDVKLDIFARRDPGGIPFSHPYVRCVRKILDSLGVEPRLAPSISELAAFIDYEIPALTLGITAGDNLNENDESIQIEPMYRGIAQILGTIKAIDGGCCEQD